LSIITDGYGEDTMIVTEGYGANWFRRLITAISTITRSISFKSWIP